MLKMVQYKKRASTFIWLLIARFYNIIETLNSAQKQPLNKQSTLRHILTLKKKVRRFAQDKHIYNRKKSAKKTQHFGLIYGC